VSFETAVEQWREGERRLAEAPREQQDVLERVTTRILAELRRRLGGAFTAPDHPYAWDARVVTDAAFGRYLRRAADYAGGRRRF
jgi:hypothetical protein